jgi:hypothetical protein
MQETVYHFSFLQTENILLPMVSPNEKVEMKTFKHLQIQWCTLSKPLCGCGHWGKHFVSDGYSSAGGQLPQSKGRRKNTCLPAAMPYPNLYSNFGYSLHFLSYA